MDRFKAMQTFVRIVEANSFSKAAETMDLPRASLTATMQKLEAYLGARLIQRTTRRLSLTPEGEAYYGKCLAILGALDEAEGDLRGQDAANPRGKLRIDMPGTVGRNLLLPRLAEFRARYPNIELMLGMNDRHVDLTQEGLDCSIRVGHLADSDMVARPLGSMRFVTCAAPSYLVRHGTPRTIEELRQHQAVIYFSGRTGRPYSWDFVIDGRVVPIDMPGTLAVNESDAMVLCCLHGQGLMQAARFRVQQYLDRGELVEVLPQWQSSNIPMWLLYPRSRTPTPRLMAFADWIAGVCRDDPALAPVA